MVGVDLLLRDEGGDDNELSSEVGELNIINQLPVVMTSSSSSSSSSSSRVSALMNRLLTIRTLSDVLQPAQQYTILHYLLYNPQKTLPIFLLLYVLLLVLWIPCYIAAYTLYLTPIGVLALLLLSIASIGRYILRLLVFPGSNVRIYREVENEYSNYSCTMLGSVSETIDNFIHVLTIDNQTMSSTAEKMMMTNDVQATYIHTMDYCTKILGVYIDVLHCLFDESGGGQKNDDSQQKQQQPL